jgi:hypothetical protein
MLRLCMWSSAEAICKQSAVGHKEFMLHFCHVPATMLAMCWLVQLLLQHTNWHLIATVQLPHKPLAGNRQSTGKGAAGCALLLLPCCRNRPTPSLANPGAPA